MVRHIIKGINTGLEKLFGVRITPSSTHKGVIGKVRGVFKPNPRDYSTTEGEGEGFCPCQIEVYFLALNKYVDEGDRVLDVGFGRGSGLTTLSIKAGEIHGVDVDRKAYEFCRSGLLGKNPKLKNVSLYDGYTLEYPNNYFDVVTCVEVLEHVEDYQRLLKEMLRVSKKGVFITTPNRRPEYTDLDGTPKNHWHLREWSFAELDAILREHGKVLWNCVNGPFNGPFTISETERADTLDLVPFVQKL